MLNPEIGLVIWTSIAFLGLMFLLTKFAWKPILSALKDREDTIKDALNAAEAAKAEMEELTADNEKLIRDAKAERDALLAQAKVTADQMISEAKTAASEEGQKLIEKAKQAIEQEQKTAVAKLKEEAASLSIDIAEKVIRKELGDKSSQTAYAKELVDSSDLSKF